MSDFKPLPTDPDLLGSLAALKRAARRALELAKATNTQCLVMRDGVLVDLARQAPDSTALKVIANAIRFDDDKMWIELSDGRVLGVPLVWFPRLLNASPEQRAAVTLSPAGLHWDVLDEDISLDGLLAGRGDMTRSPVCSKAESGALLSHAQTNLP